MDDDRLYVKAFLFSQITFYTLYGKLPSLHFFVPYFLTQHWGQKKVAPRV